jgi:carbamoyl-phosphate synthase small subunit
MDLAKRSPRASPIHGPRAAGSWAKAIQSRSIRSDRLPFHVVAYDYGIKRNILRMLAERGCRVTVVPAHNAGGEVLALKPDGVFLSNGPGDPEPCDYAIAPSARCSMTAMPVFGICLGHQLLGLASGADAEDEVRPSRREPSGEGPRDRPGGDHQPEPRLRRRPGQPAADVEATHRSLFDGSCRAWRAPGPPGLRLPGSPGGEPRPARHRTSSTAFELMRPAGANEAHAQAY